MCGVQCASQASNQPMHHPNTYSGARAHTHTRDENSNDNDCTMMILMVATFYGVITYSQSPLIHSSTSNENSRHFLNTRQRAKFVWRVFFRLVHSCISAFSFNSSAFLVLLLIVCCTFAKKETNTRKLFGKKTPQISSFVLYVKSISRTLP